MTASTPGFDPLKEFPNIAWNFDGLAEQHPSPDPEAGKEETSVLTAPPTPAPMDSPKEPISDIASTTEKPAQRKTPRKHSKKAKSKKSDSNAADKPNTQVLPSAEEKSRIKQAKQAAKKEKKRAKRRLKRREAKSKLQVSGNPERVTIGDDAGDASGQDAAM